MRRILTAATLGGLLALAVAAQQLPRLQKVYPGPEQPLPFSHKAHAGRGVECKTCHTTPDPGDFAEIIEAKTCMGCHEAAGADHPAMAKLAEFAASGEWVPWEPVYLVPDYVFFSHREHEEKAQATCADCHGDVAAAEVLGKERDISMAACMECHRAKGASLECDYCHEPRGAAP